MPPISSCQTCNRSTLSIIQRKCNFRKYFGRIFDGRPQGLTQFLFLLGNASNDEIVISITNDKGESLYKATEKVISQFAQVFNLEKVEAGKVTFKVYTNQKLITSKTKCQGNRHWSDHRFSEGIACHAIQGVTRHFTNQPKRPTFFRWHWAVFNWRTGIVSCIGKKVWCCDQRFRPLGWRIANAGRCGSLFGRELTNRWSVLT